MAIDEMQGVLRPARPIADLLYDAEGVVRLEDLDWPTFDSERVTTMPEYLGEIGLRMDERPRESSVKDSALGLYRNDFEQATVQNLESKLYFPNQHLRGQRPRKGVIRISGGHPGLDVRRYTGVTPLTTGVAVTEEIFEEVVQNAPYYSNRIANRTERANRGELVVEDAEDLGGESALYALLEKHEILETRTHALIAVRSKLSGVNRHIKHPDQGRRIQNLELYRMVSMTAIQSTVRVACKQLGYGKNRTQNTLNAAASNMTRSPKRAEWLADYVLMAGRHNNAALDKVIQSIHGIMDELKIQAPHAINNIDREYTD